ncbi:DUF805 domain-containing protein [Massilia sp. S19_KUP03_FR1]|uniref:DUF805 domain-containing protein n=1 Tax=Massilia sp. S19_KUP03_FR1 TaxID=3025503 RepID=UPI002FCCCD9E
MTVTDSISTCFKKYATFDGTASVSEFWWFFLFQVIVSLLARMLGSNLNLLVSLAIMLPAIAVGCRRLHDTDRSGWLQLLWFIPVIGWIVLVVFWVQDGKANRYGGAAN